jgi:Tol biopolymer transport system component/DNA-binding winged helix-turn-helix (wHTH) protein
MNLEVVVFESLGLRVDTAAYRVSIDGRPLALEPKAFDLLVFLLSHGGELVTKQQILDTVWQGTAVSDNALTRVIAQLRKALGDDARQASFLETVPTRGYRWIAPVTINRARVQPEPSATGLRTDSESGDGTTQVVESNRGKLARSIVLTICVLGVLTAVAWLWVDRRAAEPRAVFPRQLTMSAGVDLFPALSPDGQRLAYSSDRSGAWEIYVRPTAGGTDVALTSDGNQNMQPAWSPDGAQIAFHSIRRGGIWIATLDGSALRQISDFGARPAWSPDGRRLAFQTDAAADIGPAARPANLPSTIWIVEAAGGQPRPLTQRGVPTGGHGSPTWSPDGRHIAFATAGFALTQIWAVEVNGGDPFPLVSDATTAFDPVYVPDGRALVFTSARMLWRIALDANGRAAGPRESYVPASLAGLRHLSVSRDGRIALSALNLESSLSSVSIDPDGAAAAPPRPLTNDTRLRNSLPAFSPDGTRIAVMSSVAGNAPDVWTMNADGTDLQQLTDSRGYEADPSWTPDSREVVFKTIRDRAVGLWAIEVNTRRERRVLDFGPLDRIRREQGLVEEAAMSPDATRIAYTVLDPRTSTKALYVRNIAARDSVRLTTGEPPVGYPAWSPDGNWIALEVFEPGRTDVAVVPANGGPMQRLTSTRGQSWVHGFSPESTRVLFAGQRDGVWNVYWVPRGGGDEHRVTNNTAVGVFMRYPAWSPRADQIVYEYGVVRGNIWLVELR